MAVIPAVLKYVVDTRDLDKADDSLQKMDKSAEKAEKTSKKLSLAMKGIGIASAAIVASGVAFIAASKKTLAYADSLAKAADKAGITIERLQEMRYVGELNGIAFTQMDAAMAAFSNRLGKDLVGSSGAATKSLEALGLTADINAGKFTNSDQVMMEAINRVGELGTAQEKAAHLTNLFGDEVGKRMVVMLKNGSSAVHDMIKEANDLGIIMDANLVRRAEAANDAMFRLSEVIRVQTMSAVLELMPEITNFVNLLVQNKDEVLDFARNIGSLAAGFMELVAMTAKSITNLAKFLGAMDYALDETVAKTANAYTKAKEEGAGLFETEKAYTHRLAKLHKEYKAALDASVASQKKFNELAGGASVVADPTSRDKPPLSIAPKANTGSSDAARAAADSMRAHEEKTRFIMQINDDLHAMQIANIQDEQERLVAQTDFAIEQFTRRYDAELAKHNLTNEEMVLATTTRNETIEQMQLASQERLTEMSKSSFDRLMEDWADTTAQMKEASVGWANQSADALTDFAMTGEADFKGLATSIIRQLIKIQIQEMMTRSFSSLGGIFGGLFGGGAPVTSINALGNVFSNGKVTAFEDGGVVNSPTLFPMANGTGLMGEAGPEAVMPLKRGADGKLGVASSGGQGSKVVNINTTVNVQGNADGQQISTAVVNSIKSLVKQEIGNSIRPGNMLNPTQSMS